MNIIERDLQHVWHPCTQMKDYEQFPPIAIQGATGCHLQLENGTHIIDAISSWWCKSLGHGDKRLFDALVTQASKLEHVLLADITHETIVALSEKLCALTPHLKKVLYASDGSCAVEIAAKMALHAQQLKGNTQRTEFMALQNGYHGETLLALSLSDLGAFRDPYETLLTKTHFLQDIPYVHSTADPLWSDCSAMWPAIEAQLMKLQDKLCAIAFEPIVQGSCGMQIYSADFLQRLARWAKAHDIYLIADEIMTGLGRTGKMLACEYADIQSDFLCLAKGLTAGWLPMSVCLTTNEIYDLFYDDYESKKIFIHSHTHSGNALCAAVALKTLEIIEEEDICERAHALQSSLMSRMQEVAHVTQKLRNIRGIGGIVAADLIEPLPARAGYQVYQEALKRGALLRPLGNTIYWLPPLIIKEKTLDQLQDITAQAIQFTLTS